MNAQCRFAGDSCRRDAAAVVRIDRVGDRAICAEHLAWMTEHGMAFRRLDERMPLPAWRQRDLRRDWSGRIRSAA